jgi:predicted SAM-dependent methyltransferase
MSLKQSFGRWIIPRLPFNEHVFKHFRLELTALTVRANHLFNPLTRMRIWRLRHLKGVKLNLGCGPYGLDGWVNLDLYSHNRVTLTSDCRYALPIGDETCRGIHVEHYFEHLNPTDERGRFLGECLRCLEPGGVLRIIVPDAERFVRAYVADGWSDFDELSADGDLAQANFRTKMEALNHIFLQDHEHYGGYDFETLASVLRTAGLRDVTQCKYRQGDFPDGCIDRDQHQRYSLYVESVK